MILTANDSILIRRWIEARRFDLLELHIDMLLAIGAGEG